MSKSLERVGKTQKTRFQMSPKSQNFDQEITLDALLNSFETFLSEVSQGIVGASPGDENRTLAETMAATLNDQLKKVHLFIRENHEKISPVQQEEMRKFLRTQDGHNMAQRGTETAKSILTRGNFGKKFLQWLIRWFQEIKKVIKELLQILCDILGWSFPSWLDKLLQILDEVWNAFVAFLADVVGIDGRSFAREASDMEVDYLNELAAFERLRHAQRSRKADQDDQ